MKDLFDEKDAKEAIERIGRLTPSAQGQWGKLDVAQMLAHLNVAYEKVYENKHPVPGGLKKLLLRWFVKNMVVGPKPYPKNGRTAPEFVVASPKVFAAEKERLVGYLRKTQALGRGYFDQKASISFGPLSAAEWNTMFYKHLDHHLRQFGV